MFGLFVIEAGSEPVAVLDVEGKPYVFDTGAAAARFATLLGQTGHHASDWQAIKCQPRRLASDAWKARELARFADGTYTALPWADLPTLSLTADHFAHVSTEDGAKVAYTQDAQKGAGDIQTRVKPGKYLAQFYGDIFDAPTIARMAAEFSLAYGDSIELQFADTQDDIERVYTNGPRSCMAYSADHFSSSMHPTRVYAAGDLAVAYIVRNGDITARALCWPAKKLYGRVYGDETRLVDLLDTAGYSDGPLDGARMLRIEERGGFIVPYIDHCCCAGDAGTHLILGHDGVKGDSQNGLSDPAVRCTACSCSVDEDDARSNDDGDMYCDECFSDEYGYCERYDESVPRDELMEVICRSRYTSNRRTTQYWGERARENEAFVCDGNGDWYSNDFLVTLADGTSWSQDYFEDYGFTCGGNGDCYHTDDMVQLEDGTQWSQDHFDDHGVTVDGINYAKGDEPKDDAESDGDAAPQASAPRRASPTVHCEAQLEMPLALSLRIEGPDCAGDWLIKDGDHLITFLPTLTSAQSYLDTLRAQRAAA